MAALLLSGCGSASTVETDAAGPGTSTGQTMSCTDGAEPIAELLRSGLPMYDYDPAADLTELIFGSDVVVAGTLASAIRVEGPTDTEELEPIETQLTQLEASEFEVLWAVDEASADMVEVFGTESWWADSGSVDPLAAGVTFANAEVGYVAFLHVGDFWPLPTVGVQGFVIGCGGESANPVIEPLPPDVSGLSVGELADRISETLEPGRSTARGETESIPHRVLIDGMDDESQASWSTAVLSADEVWAIEPNAELDTDNEVFFGFWLAESGSCPFAPMAELRHDVEFGVIFPEVPLADPMVTECEDDDNPHLIVVAVSREHLPSGALTLWVNGEEPWAEGSTFIADGELTAMSSAVPYELLADPGELAVGETRFAAGVSTHCGLERIYRQIDGRQWILDPRSNDVPAQWNDVIRGEAIDLVITRTAADQLEVVAFDTGEGATYVPASDLEGCD